MHETFVHGTFGPATFLSVHNYLDVKFEGWGPSPGEGVRFYRCLMCYQETPFPDGHAIQKHWRDGPQLRLFL